MPAQELRMIPITWPFAVWGLDMVGPFKRSKDKKTHLLVAVDKFTKWVETKPVSKCDGCQKFSRRAHMPAQELRMIPFTWTFAVWGLDMVGPFKMSKDKKSHLLVAADKFTKWVEVEPVSKCDAATAVQFIKKVIFRFGFPHSIITDKGTNLSKGAMKEFCQHEHIRLDVS